jgi:hypothetical protein
MLVVWINVAARGLDINDVRLYFGRFIMNPASTNVAALNRSICTLVASVQCTEASVQVVMNKVQTLLFSATLTKKRLHRFSPARIQQELFYLYRNQNFGRFIMNPASTDASF